MINVDNEFGGCAEEAERKTIHGNLGMRKLCKK